MGCLGFIVVFILGCVVIGGPLFWGFWIGSTGLILFGLLWMLVVLALGAMG